MEIDAEQLVTEYVPFRTGPGLNHCRFPAEDYDSTNQHTGWSDSCEDFCRAFWTKQLSFPYNEVRIMVM